MTNAVDKPNRTEKVKVLISLDNETREMLNMLADAHGNKKSEFARAMIRKEYRRAIRSGYIAQTQQVTA